MFVISVRAVHPLTDLGRTSCTSMFVKDQFPGKLWLETPLIHSPHISSRLGCNVYLKLENLQPSQSFKYRGISHFAQNARKTHGPDVHLVIASGGNAGIAAACAAHALGMRCTVFLPEGASASTLEFLKEEGAEVIIEGSYYLQALGAAERVVKEETNAVMIPAYDDAIVWEGHSSMIPEIAQQLPPGTRPDAVVCSVGGGGLSGGVMMGCKSVGWDDVPFIALETTGSNCFYEALAANTGAFSTSGLASANVRVEHDATHDVNIAHLATLKSKATSLGASSAAPGVVRMALDRKGGIKSVCVPDEFAMQAAIQFAEDHKTVVELACSTTLTAAYNRALFDKLVPPSPSGTSRTVVFVVCGGYKISLEELEDYRTIVESKLWDTKQWDILCNGEQWVIDK